MNKIKKSFGFGRGIFAPAFYHNLYRVMGKHSDGARRNHAHSTQRIAPEAVFFVWTDTHGGEVIGAGRTYRACRRCANVSQQAYAVAVRSQKHPCKAIPRKPTRRRKNGDCLANVAEHAFHQTIQMMMTHLNTSLNLAMIVHL